MYQIVTDKQQITNAQKIFQDTLIGIATKRYICNVGHRGGRYHPHPTDSVYWLESLGIWVDFIEAENRYWNAFGTVKPKYDGCTLAITCEINFPYIGIDRMIGGAFATDVDGSIYVLYRGRIGGGRSGISKSLFMENYEGQWITLYDGDRETTVALIGKLGDAMFPSNVANFVREVDRIKRMVH